MTARRRPTALIWCAGLLGLLNAGPSVYWAFGGDFLMDTIGQWLIDLRTEMPVLTGLALLGIALGKTVAVLVPLLAVFVQGRHRVLWWNLARIIAAALVLYGAAGLLINAVLLLWPGLVLTDPTARIGQALIWYPMLLVWGIVLALGLRRWRVQAF